MGYKRSYAVLHLGMLWAVLLVLLHVSKSYCPSVLCLQMLLWLRLGALPSGW